MPNIKDQSGVLLLLAIVMTTVILTAALIMSTVIIREIRVSQISDKGQIALFAAESASEDAVFQLLQLGVDPVALDGASGSFSTGATWSRSVSNETNEFVVDYIPPNGSEVVNLYNRTKGNARAEVSSLSLSWSSGTLLAIDASTWDGSALSALSPLQTFPCAAGSCSASVPLDPTKGYALVFTAEGTAITDLIISLAPANNLVETAVTVKVVGEYRGAEQALEIILPEPPPWESTPEAPEVSLTCGDRVLDAGEDCDPLITVAEITDVVSGGVCPIAPASCDFVPDGVMDILDIQYVIINLNSQNCSTIEGYAGGQSCNTATCSWDACVSPENCGDGDINGIETCEPPNTPSCDSACQEIDPCGNGVLDAGELCEQGDSLACTTGGYNGTQQCNATCDAWAACSPTESCGDGVLNGPEQCDTAMVNPLGCQSNCTVFGEVQYMMVVGSNVMTYPVTGDILQLYSFDGTATDSSYWYTAGAWGGFYTIVELSVDESNDNVIRVLTSFGGGFAISTRVVTYTPAGTLSTIMLSEPAGNIAVRGSDIWGFWQYELTKYSSSGAVLVKTGAGQFSIPVSTKIDSNGDVYIVDMGNNRIMVYNSAGTYLTTWGSWGSGNGQFWSPLDLAISGSYVYVVDSARVQKFTTSGLYQLQWTVGGAPSKISTDSAGNVIVLVRNGSIFSLEKYDPNGNLLATLP